MILVGKTTARHTRTRGLLKSSCFEKRQFHHQHHLELRQQRGPQALTKNAFAPLTCIQAPPQREATTNAVRLFATLGRDNDTNKDSSSRSDIVVPLPSTAEASSSSSSSSSDTHHFERTVYVHRLSQIILEYFQDHRSEWLIRQGLDCGLTLHRDGSFELIRQRRLDDDAEDGKNNGITDDNKNNSSDNNEILRIWTSFDEQEKKHWMTVLYNKKRNRNDRRHGTTLHERFLLQDNMASSWHTNRTSLPERIHLSIEELIAAVDQLNA